jgi:F0F1-type ATP synthase membrane subunit c/vacuolar-type H+-ATPase subunit K
MALTPEQQTAITQYTPLVNGVLMGIGTIIGGASQQNLSHDLSQLAREKTRREVKMAKIMGRISLSKARMEGLQAGTDEAPLWAIAQLAGELERNVYNIRSSGQLTANYYKNIGDQALYGGIASGFAALGQGIARADELGLFAKEEKTKAPTTTPAPAGGPPIMLAPGVGIGGTSDTVVT